MSLGPEYKEILKQKLFHFSITLMILLVLLIITLWGTFGIIQESKSLPIEKAIGEYLLLPPFYFVIWIIPTLLIYISRHGIKDEIKEIFLLLRGKDPWEIPEYKQAENEDLRQYF
jgi:hypothetical protein